MWDVLILYKFNVFMHVHNLCIPYIGPFILFGYMYTLLCTHL